VVHSNILPTIFIYLYIRTGCVLIRNPAVYYYLCEPDKRNRMIFHEFSAILAANQTGYSFIMWIPNKTKIFNADILIP
jgi:hypothetical protein